MASTTHFYPVVIPYNSDHRSNREKAMIKCIESNPEWEAVSLRDGEYTEEQIQMIQLCTDAKEADMNTADGWIMGIVAIIIIGLIGGTIWACR